MGKNDDNMLDLSLYLKMGDYKARGRDRAQICSKNSSKGLSTYLQKL